MKEHLGTLSNPRLFCVQSKRLGVALFEHERDLRRDLPDPVIGRSPKRGFRAVVAEFEGAVIGRLRPCTRDAFETFGLVLHPEQPAAAERNILPDEMRRDRPQRSPPSRCAGIRLKRDIGDVPDIDRLGRCAAIEQGERCNVAVTTNCRPVSSVSERACG